MKHLSIIIILILALMVAGGQAIYEARRDSNGVLTPEQRSALPYLIDNMEHARKTHQDIVDDPVRFGNWVRAGVDHQVWVDIYEETIGILKLLNKGR